MTFIMKTDWIVSNRDDIPKQSKLKLSQQENVNSKSR